MKGQAIARVWIVEDSARSKQLSKNEYRESNLSMHLCSEETTRRRAWAASDALVTLTRDSWPAATRQ